MAFAQAMLTSNQLKESIEAWEGALERILALCCLEPRSVDGS